MKKKIVYNKNLDLIETAQNKLKKVDTIPLSLSYKTLKIFMYKETNIMNGTQTYNYNTCLLIHKILNKDIHR